MAIVYTVSDSVGETAESVVRAARAQFDASDFEVKRVHHVKDFETIEETFQRAQAERAMIVFTIVVPELRNHVRRCSETYKVPVVDIMGPMIDAFKTMVGKHPQEKAGLMHQLDADYFRRVEAIEFAVKYDDGKDPRGLERADVVLVGVSRTSKTPLSMYLAHRKVCVANIPLVPEVKAPSLLFRPEYQQKIIGLTIRPEALNRIRLERLRALGLGAEAKYASRERIEEELYYAESLMRQIGCKVIDVSDRAVEETAFVVLEYLDRMNLVKHITD